jgi:hypothetical protein
MVFKELPTLPVFLHHLDVSSSVALLRPSEFAFFSRSSARELIKVLPEAYFKRSRGTIRDYYFDTAEKRFFNESSSLRVREYINRQTTSAFDIIWVSWGGDKQKLNTEPRSNSIVVQCFPRAGKDHLNAALVELERRGYEMILSLQKVRHAFEFQATVSTRLSTQIAAYGELATFTNRVPVFFCKDSGLRILIDEMNEAFVEDVILEVEFDDKHRDQAVGLTAGLVNRMDGNLSHKRQNKICYFLNDEKMCRSRGSASASRVRLTSSHSGLSGAMWQNLGDNPESDAFIPGFGPCVLDRWRRHATPQVHSVEVWAPGRLHFGVWDRAKLKIGLPGGGGVGTSTSTVSHRLLVSSSRTNASRKTSSIPSLRHLVDIFGALVGYDMGMIDVSVLSRIKQVHCGYGSNVSLNTTALIGLNAFFGNPFSLQELFEVAVANYIENYDGARVTPGMDTGVGEAALLHGGVVWVESNATYFGNLPIDSLYVVTADGIPSKLLKQENDSVGRRIDFDVDGYVSEILRPAFNGGDPMRFFESCWKMNKLWISEIGSTAYRVELLDGFAEEARNSGALYAGLSSEGTCMFALAPSLAAAKRIRTRLAEKLSDGFVNFKAGQAACAFKLKVHT